MTRNKKLRLLVTKKCHNDCPKCCNRQYDLDAIPVIDRFDYDEVCITGGEPMLDFPLWKIKDMEWLDECPVPEGEDFRRVAYL